MDPSLAPRAVKVQELTLSGFQPFGNFANMFLAQRVAASPLRTDFYRDAKQLGLSPAGLAAIDMCLAEPRSPVIDVLECRSGTALGVLPVDGDILLQLAPNTFDDALHLDDISVFFVPRGTLCTLHPGVWHHAPYPAGGKTVLALFVQPAPVVADGCSVAHLQPWQRIEIER